MQKLFILLSFFFIIFLSSLNSTFISNERLSRYFFMSAMAQGEGDRQGQGDRSEKDPQVVEKLENYNPLGTTDINVIIARITKALLGIIGTISFAVFVLSGVRLIFSQGSEEQITKAKDTMIWALIGLVIALGSYAILDKIFNVLTTTR